VLLLGIFDIAATDRADFERALSDAHAGQWLAIELIDDAAAYLLCRERCRGQEEHDGSHDDSGHASSFGNVEIIVQAAILISCVTCS
jgi:hypothetical protein